MNYKETLEYIHSVSWMGSRPGLERISELEEKLGNPEEDLKFIHVAGTNGKGSVCSMLSHIMVKAGYKTGLFTSPYIQSFNERIQINNAPISEVSLSNITEKVKNCADKMSSPPTEFELLTAIAFEFFHSEKCDIVILETGMGGRLDSTNVIKSPALSVITGVDYDHTAILGDSIEQIAVEKSGIIKEGRPVVFGEGSPEVRDIIRKSAAESCSELICVDYSRLSNEETRIDGSRFDFSPLKGYGLSMVGEYQLKNAAAAITCVETLRRYGINISESAVREGLLNAKWKARFEILYKSPLVIYDGAHNPGGVEALAGNIKRIIKDRVILVMAVMKDKDYCRMVETMSSVTDSVYAVKPDIDRALEPEVLSECFNNTGVNAKAYRVLPEGIKAAVCEAEVRRKPLIIMGTLFMYSEAVESLKRFMEKAD